MCQKSEAHLKLLFSTASVGMHATEQNGGWGVWLDQTEKFTRAGGTTSFCRNPKYFLLLF
jgi:hypothetical protein